MLSEQEQISLRILLSDPFGSYSEQALTKVLSDKNEVVRLHSVARADDFEAVYASDQWDAVLLAYPTSDEVLEVVGHIDEQTPIILICGTQAEAENAYQEAPFRFADVVTRKQLSRLNFILQREARRQSPKWERPTNQPSLTGSLARSEARFRSVIDGFNDLILFADQYQIIRYANLDALMRHLGYQVSNVIGRPFATFLHDDEKAAISQTLGEVLKTPSAQQLFECQIQRADGTWEAAEITAHSMTDPTGQPSLTLHVRIITEQKRASEKIKSLNRTLGVLSDVNQAIVRIRDIDELCQTICDIAVQKGDFHMAWIGMVDYDTDEVIPIANAGFAGDYLSKINVSLHDDLRGHGPMAMAIHTGKHFVINDTETDPIMVPLLKDSRRLGFRSQVSLPLIFQGKARGALVLYAQEPNFFDDDDLKLVDEMAGDVAFAMAFAEREQRQKQMEMNLLESEGRYHRMLDDLLEGAEIIDFDWRYLYVNEASAAHGRMTREQLLGNTVLEMYPGIEQSELFGYLKKCMDERTPQHFESLFTFPDGATTWFELSVQPIREGIFILSLDISERKKAEFSMQQYAKRMKMLHEMDTGLMQGHSIAELIRSTLKNLRELIPCQAANVTLIDQVAHEGQIFAIDFKQETAFTEGKRFPLPPDVYEGYDQRGIRLFDDIRPLEASSPRVKQLLSEGLVSLMSVMLTNKGKPIGSLVLVSDTTYFFKSEYQEIAAEVANQLAIAVQQNYLSDSVRQSEEQYRLLAENMADVVWVLDIDARKYIYVSPSVYQLRGYTQEETLQQSLEETLTPSSLKIFTEGLSERVTAFLAGDPSAVAQTYEVEQPCKDGSVVWTERATTLLQDASGAVRMIGVTRDITQRREAEAELREREEWLRLSMEASGLGKWRYNTQTGLLHMDERAQSHYGFNHNPVSAQELISHIHHDDVEHFTHGMTATLDPARQTKGAMEFRVIHPDGSVRWLSALSYIYFEGQGGEHHAVYGFGTSQDITERKQSEEAVNRQTAILQQSRDLIAMSDLDSRVIYMNASGATLTGYESPDDVLGKLITDFFTVGDMGRMVNEYLPQALATGNWRGESRLKTRDGKLIDIDQTIFPIHDEKGRLQYYATIIVDITERKQAEERLRQSEARQRAMLSAIPDFMIRARANGTLLDYHAPEAENLALIPENIIGQNVGKYLPPELAHRLIAQIQQVGTTKQPIESEFVIPLKSIPREFESRMVPVGEDEVLAIVRDVSERRRAEKELQSLYNATSYLFKADSLLGLGRQIVAAVVREFEHSDCGIMLLDKSKQNVMRLARTGQMDIRPENLLHLDGDGLVPLALRTGEIIYAADVTENKNYVASEAATQSELVIPLKTSKGIIGVLDMQHPQKDAFSERDRRILIAYAERAAPAIEIMQLYEELNQRAADLEWRVAQRTVELNTAKERAEAILNHSADGIILLDSNMVIERTNPAFEEMFGAKDSDYVGCPFSELLAEEERNTISELFQANSTNQKVWRTEIRACRKDGRTFDAELGVGFIRNNGLVCVIRDITERKERERQLRFDASIQSSISDAVIVTDMSFKIQSWNKAAEAIYGWNAEEAIGQTAAILKTEFESADEQNAVRTNFLNAEQWHDEAIQQRKDGTPIYIQSSITVFKDENGVPIGIIAVNRDITERRKAQEILRVSEGRYRLLAENITDIISRVTPGGVYVDVSPSSKAVLGYTPEEMIGRQDIEFAHPDDVGILMQQRNPAINPRSEFPLTYRFRHRDGHYLWLEVARKYILAPDTHTIKEYVISARDITVRKRAEEALKHALEKEKELGELKSRFVSTASHEFRTPLSTILATTETLTVYRDKLKEKQITDKLNKISEQVTYLKAIIEDTLQVARLQDPKAKFEPTPLDLDAVCRSVIDEFESRPDVRQRFVYTDNSNLAQARLDRKLIRQVITNLLSNAVKYSPSDSTISITLERIDEALVFKVEDQGIGIPEADLKHLFEPFHRAANVGAISGTGLGLVIAKEAVELHGGFITVDSQVDVGTTFIIVIPLQ